MTKKLATIAICDTCRGRQCVLDDRGHPAVDSQGHEVWCPWCPADTDPVATGR